jgi:hypothetical protein
MQKGSRRKATLPEGRLKRVVMGGKSASQVVPKGGTGVGSRENSATSVCSAAIVGSKRGWESPEQARAKRVVLRNAKGI